jgi:hypothetical protein
VLTSNNLGDKGAQHVVAMLGKLGQVKTLALNLSSNQITDALILGHVQALEALREVEELTLDLGLNKLSIEATPPLFKALGSLSTLKVLRLNFESNRITPAGLKPAKQWLAGLALYELSLNLSGNRVQDTGFFEIGDLLEQLKTLRKFELVAWNCRLDDHGFSEFMKSLGKIKQLDELALVLWNNSITAKSCETFGEQIRELSLLQRLTLNLSNNPVADPGIRLICKALIELAVLEHLILGLEYTKARAHSQRYVGRLLARKRLRTFSYNASNNPLAEEGGQLLLAGLRECTSLRDMSLGLEGCEITENVAIDLARVLARLDLTRLSLVLADNGLLDESALALAKAIADMQIREGQLDLRKNQTSQVAVRQIQSEYLPKLPKAFDIKFPAQ